MPNEDMGDEKGICIQQELSPNPIPDEAERKAKVRTASSPISIPGLEPSFEDVPGRWSCDEKVTGSQMLSEGETLRHQSKEMADSSSSTPSSTVTVCPDDQRDFEEGNCAIVEVLSVPPVSNDTIPEENVSGVMPHKQSYGLQVRILGNSTPTNINYNDSHNMDGRESAEIEELQISQSLKDFISSPHAGIRRNRRSRSSSRPNSALSQFISSSVDNSNKFERPLSLGPYHYRYNNSIDEELNELHKLRSRRSLSRDSAGKRVYVGYGSSFRRSPSIQRSLLKVPISPRSSPYQSHAPRVYGSLPPQMNISNQNYYGSTTMISTPQRLTDWYNSLNGNTSSNLNEYPANLNVSSSQYVTRSKQKHEIARYSNDTVQCRRQGFGKENKQNEKCEGVKEEKSRIFPRTTEGVELIDLGQRLPLSYSDKKGEDKELGNIPGKSDINKTIASLLHYR